MSYAASPADSAPSTPAPPGSTPQTSGPQMSGAERAVFAFGDVFGGGAAATLAVLYLFYLTDIVGLPPGLDYSRDQVVTETHVHRYILERCI